MFHRTVLSHFLFFYFQWKLLLLSAHLTYFLGSCVFEALWVDNSLSVHLHLMLSIVVWCAIGLTATKALSASMASSFHSPLTEMADDFSTTDSCQHFITVAAGASWFLPGNQVSLLANPWPLHGTRPIPSYLKFCAPFSKRIRESLHPR